MDLIALVLLMSVTTIGLKAVGPLALAGSELHPRWRAAIALLLPAILAGLLLVSVVDADLLRPDARLVGVGSAAVVLMLRGPVLLAVVVAAAGTALTRLLW